MLNMAIEAINDSYAACPWNTAHIEASVEWPPSPWRILRGIISGAFAVARQDPEFNWDLGKSTILELAKTPPEYYLPPASYVQINTYRKDRNDEPSLYKSGKMLTSGELRFNSDDSTIYIFWHLKLNQEQLSILKTCIANCRYLGRSESLADWQLVAEVEVKPNCYPDPNGLVQVLNPNKDVQFADLLKSPRQIFDIEARQYIPGATYINYKLEQNTSRYINQQDFDNNYARLDLIANFPLKKENTLYFGDKLHKALVHSQDGSLPLANFAGIDFSVNSPKDNYARNNNHAYFVPIIQNGLIIAFEVYCEAGFSKAEEDKLAGLRTLRTKYNKTRGITIRLSLLGQKSNYCQASRTWESSTPFFLPRIPATRRGKPRAIAGSIFQKDGPEHQALKLLLHLPQFEHLKNEDLNNIFSIEYVPDIKGLQMWVDGSLFCTSLATPFDHWWKWDSNRIHGKKAIRNGYWLRLEFAQPQIAPISLGYSAHFGLGVLSSVGDGVVVEKTNFQKNLLSQ